MPSDDNKSNPLIKPGRQVQPLPDSDKYHRDILQAREEGRREGVKEGHADVHTYLQSVMFGPGRPDRGTPKYIALLDLSRELSEHLRSKG